MPRVVQGGVVQAEQVMDLTAEPDDATEDEESGTLQDGVLDDDDEEEDAEADHADQPQSLPTTPPAPPPGLKEISSLASWTVSSSKPGCGVSALRAPNISQFWQSDGPQPHHLNIHFFKMVSIVGMRIYLDFDLDESYTPTLIRFAAGTSYHDLQEFCCMRFEQPRGWLDVDFETGVGGPEFEDDDSEQDENAEQELRRMPTLRCMLVQVRICENHQNGKDTHLRGLQIFARDEEGMAATGERLDGREERGKRENLTIRTKRGGWEVPSWAEPPILR